MHGYDTPYDLFRCKKKKKKNLVAIPVAVINTAIDYHIRDDNSAHSTLQRMRSFDELAS